VPCCRYQAKDQLYCVAQTFDADTTERVPFYDGKVIAVYNYANAGAVNAPNVNNGTILCARQQEYVNCTHSRFPHHRFIYVPYVVARAPLRC
jgi:hypothetical protein